jgi:hypothetical protein
MKKLLGILAVLFLAIGFFLFGSDVPNADASTVSTQAVFVTDDGGLATDFPAAFRLVVEEEEEDEDEEGEDEDEEGEDEDEQGEDEDEEFEA